MAYVKPKFVASINRKNLLWLYMTCTLQYIHEMYITLYNQWITYIQGIICLFLFLPPSFSFLRIIFKGTIYNFILRNFFVSRRKF
jgi:hypothetical protein